MTRTNTPDEDLRALKRRTNAPEDERTPRHESQADAADGRDVKPARLGPELAAEHRSDDATETADALKRAAENDRRV